MCTASVVGATASILETGSFLRQRPQADFATQSGPLLVIDGRLHPRFSREGGSRKYRNGIGLRDVSTVQTHPWSSPDAYSVGEGTEISHPRQ
jgi:uncharacterized protein YigE (DUF2233 family)